MSSPPSHSSLQGPVYHSKPPGPIVDSSPPYKFDTHGEHIISNEEFHALGLGETVPVKAAINDGISGSGGNSVNVHHHYHHIDGTQNNVKAPAIVVNNPIPVPVPVGNGLSPGEFHGQQHLSSSNNFNTLTSGYDQQSFKPGNGFGNGLNGVYGNGPKPVFEGANQYEGGSGYGGSGFGGSSGGFHATNPDFYKKALKGSSNINSLGGGSNYGGLYSGPSSYEPIDTSTRFQQTPRQDSLDCVCVPYDQCPARDVLGRKGDLVLPLDPRNLGSDIEALSSESNSTATNTTHTAEDANTDDQDDDSDVETTKESVKHVSKREVAEKKSDVQKADGEAVSIQFGLLVILNFTLTH